MLKTPDEVIAGHSSSEGQPLSPPSRISARSWYAVGILALINCFALTDRIGLSMLMELIKADLQLTDKELGLVTGLAFALFNVLFSLPLAWVADRYSRVKLISICLAMWSAMTAFSGFAQTYWQLFLTRVGVGIGEAGCHPPAHSLIGDYFPREKRALGIGLFNAGAAVGVAGGMVLIGYLGETLGWRGALQVVGLLGLPLAVLAYFTLPEPPRPSTHKETAESPMKSVGALLSRPAYVHLVLGASIALIGSQGFSVWAPSFLQRSFGMGLVETGAWIGSLTAASAVLGTIAGGVIIAWLFPRDSRWEVWLPACAVAICAPMFLFMVFSPSVWIILALKAVNSFFGAIGASVAMTAVQSFAEPHRRATAVAIALLLASLLGTGAGPYFIGYVSTALEPTYGKESLRYALLIAPAMLVWAVVHYLLAARNALRDRVN